MLAEAPTPNTSRARLKPHVWRPHADPWKDVPYKQREAEPVPWPYLWSPNQVPAPRAGCHQPLLSPHAGCRRLRVAEAWLATKGLSGRQQVQGGEKTGCWGLPRGLTVGGWEERRPDSAGRLSPMGLGLPPSCPLPWSPGSCPHVALYLQHAVFSRWA